MRQLDEREWRELQHQLTRVLAPRAPEWTDAAQHDPGLGILQLLTYVLENLTQEGPLPADAAPWIARIQNALADGTRRARPAGRAEADLDMHNAPVEVELWSGVKRVRYFTGRLLTAQDFADEQQYFLDAHRRHLKALHGFGVVSGLKAEGTGAGNAVSIGAGVAIDREGREIHVSTDLTVTVPPGTPSPAYVVLEYAERAVDPAPASDGGQTQPARIEEGCRVVLCELGRGEGVPVARLNGSEAGCELDPSFVPPRARC